ncbi:hypothetical protein [Variovorax sp. ZT4R33]|uniref:hypothetical protein n=1 Tax=Variovorax sp. ZT4R33 TaxID=3443743 RepID=UPI003F44DA4B
MPSTDRLDLRARCKKVIGAPVPAQVLQGNLSAITQYKADSAYCAAFARTGAGLARARFAVARLEAMQASSQ